MMSFGARLDLLKRQAILYIEEKVRNEKAYRNVPGDLFMCNSEVYIQDNTIGRYKLCTCSAERLSVIADKIHFRPLGDVITCELKGKSALQDWKDGPAIIKKEEDMKFEIKNDVPLPARFAEKLEPKMPSVSSKTGRINYSNLPLRAMKKGDCIVLFEGQPREKMISKKYSAIAGIRRMAGIMGLPNSFYVDSMGEDKICVWRVA